MKAWTVETKDGKTLCQFFGVSNPRGQAENKKELVFDWLNHPKFISDEFGLYVYRFDGACVFTDYSEAKQEALKLGGYTARLDI